jgi:hypothetical protein
MPSSLKINDQFPQSTSDQGLPEIFTRACPDVWKVCGEGVFSWSVFRFYTARLLTHSGTFDPKSPFLLDLQYLRALTGAQIVSTSLDEIARLFDVSEKQRADWSCALVDMIPSVVLGDRLIGWFVPEHQVRLFSATQSLGQIQDPDFVRMFSGIWLDDRTRSPQLRLALLGQSPLVMGEVEA